MAKTVLFQKNSLTTQGIGILSMLALQYILGMTTNLFVSFPNTKIPEQLWEFAWRQIPLALHIVLGLLIFINAIMLFIRSYRSGNVLWTRISLVGFVAIVAAIWGGVTFIPTQTNSYSYIMALAFIVAVIAYTWGIYVALIRKE